VLKIVPVYVDVIVVNWGACTCGTCIRTVPICPGTLGANTVDVASTVPEYIDVIVVNMTNSGTWTTIVPSCPEVGKAIVEVLKAEPVYGTLIVVKSCNPCGTSTTTVPVWPGKLGVKTVKVLTIVPE
jgi:hypothetical protein